MASLKVECPFCHKTAKLKSEFPFGKKFMRSYQCGHTEFTDRAVNGYTPTNDDIAIINDIDVETNDILRFDDDGGCLIPWTKPVIDESYWALSPTDPYYCAECREVHAVHHAYEFQRTGVEFSERANYSALIADAMGLGKTVQGLLLIRRNIEELTPTLFVVKGSTQLQWCNQLKYWLDDSPLGVMPIMNRESIIKGFRYYVVSMDFLARKGVLDKIIALDIKLVIVDECQNFKNLSSQRTKALIAFIEQCTIKYKVFLSGTPIKNRASEYYPVLNLLDPARFHSPMQFNKHWLIPNEKDVYTRIDPHMIDAFHEVTSKYIIRREKRDVLKNLPKLMPRDYQYMEIEDPLIKNAYNNELDLLSNFQRTAGKINSTVLLGWLAKMRAITGQAKVPWALEYTEEFMNDTEDSLILGIHHVSVRDTLYYAMRAKGYNVVKFSGEDNIYAKERAKNSFIARENRLMIMNMLAGGVGVDGLQKVCSNAVVLERQWNAADEEQFESRLDRDGQKVPCTFVYPIAKGTIDEWFHDGVQIKRKICAETMDDKFDVESDEDFLKDLVDKTLANRL